MANLIIIKLYKHTDFPGAYVGLTEIKISVLSSFLS